MFLCNFLQYLEKQMLGNNFFAGQTERATGHAAFDFTVTPYNVCFQLNQNSKLLGAMYKYKEDHRCLLLYLLSDWL